MNASLLAKKEVKMKIAYVILSHKDSTQLKRVCEKLTKNTENSVFIHLDKKTKFDPIHLQISKLPNVYFVNPRYKIYWAGFNAIKATLDSFNYALNTDSYKRFVLMQCLDYPIKSNTYINDFFNQHSNTEFIKAVDETSTADSINSRKYSMQWNFDHCRLIRGFLNKLNIILIEKLKLRKPKPLTITINNEECHIYRGWAQIALTRDCVEYILETSKNNKKLLKYFKNTFAPDESFFHTIIYNSSFANNVYKKPINREVEEMLNLTYFDYTTNIKVFESIEEFKQLDLTNYLFIRKIPSTSSVLLDYIDQITDGKFTQQKH